jgi:DNA-binding NtrC family response regulator
VHVLVCDDDPDIGVFLQTLFDLEGWTTQLVTSGADALAAAEESDTEIDAVILDQVMPGLTGIETARRLRRKKFDRPIILCSGHIGADLAGPIKRLGLIPCNKIDIDALVRIVQSAVRTAARERRLARREQQSGAPRG